MEHIIWLGIVCLLASLIGSPIERWASKKFKSKWQQWIVAFLLLLPALGIPLFIIGYLFDLQ